MKIRKLHIENFRSLRNVTLQVSDLTTLVGRNNTGKSNLLRALKLFFNPSTRYLDETSFYNKETDRTIRMVARFDDLSEWEEEKFSRWVDQGTLRIGYEMTCSDTDNYDIARVAIVQVPEPEWLQQDEISGAKIQEWWPHQDKLEVGGHHFGARLGTSKPLVGDWQDEAEAFAGEFREDIPWIEQELKNPKGAKNVFTGSLPEFIYVPAVRDVTEETKVTQSSPFGQLIHSVLNEISSRQKDEIASELARVASRLNRGGDAERVEEIGAVESRLNELMNELMECDVEIEMEMPKLQEVFGEAQIYANDGVRTPIENKGHGMQRSMILTILRHYAELASERKAGERASERSAIIAVEEPELYLHPQSQRTLMSVFREIASGRDQVLCSTHSSLFVDIGYFDEVCRFRRVMRDGNPQTEIQQLSMEMMLEDLRARTEKEGTDEGMRSHYKNAFSSLVNEGFFADKVLIVEGPSEYYLIPPIARELGYDFDRRNVAVVHCHGKGQIDRLLRVFSGFGIPTYVWFDGDKESRKTETRRKTLELLELLGDPVEEIGDVETQVSDSYAIMATDLEDMLSDELEDHEELRGKAGDVYGDCGKALKSKYIGQVIAERIREGAGPETCPSTLRSIVERVSSLEEVADVLHDDAEALRP